AVNIWRGALVGTPRTAGRIAIDQGAALASMMSDRAIARTLEGRPLTGVGEAARLGTVAGRRLGQRLGRTVGLSYASERGRSGPSGHGGRAPSRTGQRRNSGAE